MKRKNKIIDSSLKTSSQCTLDQNDDDRFTPSYVDQKINKNRNIQNNYNGDDEELEEGEIRSINAR